MDTGLFRRWGGVGMLLLLTLTLSACLLAPGRFTSELDLRRDRTFAFRYAGEMHLLPLSKLARSNETFEPEPCHGADDGEERPCSSAEIAEQRSAWEEKQKQEAEMAKAFLGGVDPSDPEAAAELADRLRRQTGWRQVEYKGDGLFEVDFAISGKLDHDFIFPTIERFPLANAFVQIALHEDGTVRIDAPGYGPAAGGAAMGGMMQAMAMAGEQGSQGGSNMPAIDGTFTIRTDGEILANNTDEGPQAGPASQQLVWKVNSRSRIAPTALIRLAK